MSYKKLQNTDGSFNTPKYLFNYLNNFFHFIIDPCDSGNNWLELPCSFTKKQNGLKQEWNANTFINPPYGNENENAWIDKCMEERKKYRENHYFILLPAKTESNWFGRLMSYSDITIFLRPRISFIRDGKPKNGNNIGSILFGMRSLDDRGYRELREFVKFNEYPLGFKTMSNLDNDSYIVFADTNILKGYYDVTD